MKSKSTNKTKGSKAPIIEKLNKQAVAGKAKKALKEQSQPELPLSTKPVQTRVSGEGLHRLRVGDVILLTGKGQTEYVVWFVNDSRAAVAPLDSHFEHRINEEKNNLIQFLTKAQGVMDISPNSEVKILRSLGREGLRNYIDQRQSTIKENRTENMKKVKSKKAEGTHGKLGGYKGHSITSVIRAFGKAGWTLDEARAFFKREGIQVADNTIKIQIRRGAKGEEDPAPLSKDELSKIKPKVAPKAEKSEKAEKSSKKDKKSSKKAAKKDKKAKRVKNPGIEGEEEAEDADEGDAAEEGDEAGEE